MRSATNPFGAIGRDDVDLAPPSNSTIDPAAQGKVSEVQGSAPLPLMVPVHHGRGGDHCDGPGRVARQCDSPTHVSGHFKSYYSSCRSMEVSADSGQVVSEVAVIRRCAHYGDRRLGGPHILQLEQGQTGHVVL